MRLAPSGRARRAVSNPMQALPPMTTTVWPSSSGLRWVDTAVVAMVTIFLRRMVRATVKVEIVDGARSIGWQKPLQA